MTVFEVTLKTLTPVHIGDGDELRQDFDFAVRGGRTYRLNEEAVLESKEALLISDRGGQYPLPATLLKTDADFNTTSFFRYTLSGIPRSRKSDARVKSLIKDVYDCPYIPGSSLKGALRTALAWTGWNEVKPKLDRGAIGRSRSWAGQGLERKLFGPDPNRDLLRALRVSDLAGLTRAGEGMMLVNAQVLTRKSAGSPVELEAIRPEVALNGSITIDDVLFTSFAERELHFANREHWLRELMARAQKHSFARLVKLAEWYERGEGYEAIAKFYGQMLNAKIGANAALMQIGWGAGWDGKTLWTHLQTDPQLFEQLVNDFRMHKATRESPPRKPGDPFPRSKRTAMVVKDGAAKAAAPLGWVLVELKEKTHG
ncbi:MAG: type III-A CRISPR-associated RAMP protein Csm5 [Chloroflexi bacterium]|nr:type III-A CRISPR-associated RAMP protein Csm5 [Chloroflexota bacterium]